MESATASASMGKTVGSLWDGLNPHLLGRIYKLKKNGSIWEQDTSEPTVVAALTEASMEVALNWQSPFENTGAESQAPALAAMLQTGALQPVVSAVSGMFGASTVAGMEGLDESMVGAARNKVNAFLSGFEGRTGITKLNSRQVFNGMQPVKINATLLLRAWRDPMEEVERPLAQLMSWLLPQELSEDGSFIARAAGSTSGNGNGLIETLMPSLAPVPVSLRYKGRLFKELVIESVTVPLDSPIDARGRFVQLSLPVMFCSLSAIDKDDWKAMGPI